MLKTKEPPKEEARKYFIAKDAHHEYLVKREGDKHTFLLRAESREQVYGAILKELCAPVFEMTAGQMIEAAFGESQWDDSDGVKSPSSIIRLFPESLSGMRKKSRQGVSKKTHKDGRKVDPDGRINPRCRIHGCEKRKNGKSRSGQQLWRCGLCHAGTPATLHKGIAPGRTKGYKHVPLGKRPCCLKCHGAMHSHGWYKGVIRRWFCSPCKIEVFANTPPKQAKTEDRGEELEAFVREHVTRMNGHDRELRDDIVQELVTDIVAGKLTRKDVKSRKIIRRYAHSQERLRQNRHRDVSIDQPRSGDEGGLKLSDVLEG